MSKNTKNHRECYGTLFPDLEHLRYNKPTDGKAFRVFVQRIGMGTQRRELELNQDQWEECTVCTDFQSCYQLSMAKLALHRALAMC